MSLLLTLTIRLGEKCPVHEALIVFAHIRKLRMKVSEAREAAEEAVHEAKNRLTAASSDSEKVKAKKQVGACSGSCLASSAFSDLLYFNSRL